MSGDIQPRKRKGKGKKKDDFEDDVMETKAHNNNTPHHTKNNNKATSNGEGSSGGSGVVAKAIFLLLLVSLSVVVALILVELRGKQKAAMEENISTASRAGEEIVPPPPPPPPPAMDEGSVPPEASIPQDAEDEEPEALATPPLEEYVKVVREVVMESLPDEAPLQHETKVEEEVDLSKEDEQVGDASTVDEVVEVVTPVEEVVTPVEETVELPSPTPAADVDEVQLPLAEDSKPKIHESVEKEDTTSEGAPEEAVLARLVEPLETPIPTQQEEEEEEEEVKPPIEHSDYSDDNAKGEAEEPLVTDEYEEEEEEASAVPKPALKEEEVLQEEEEEEVEEDEEDWSQFGKEGNTGALTEAYLKVESLAEDIKVLDPKNAMVAQLAPHMAGVLRAMEEGQTEGLLDTLNHIQVILEDVKKRTEESEPITIPGPPPQEERPDYQHQAEPVPESVPESKSEADAEAEQVSEPDIVIESQLESLADSEPRIEADSTFQDDPEMLTNVQPDHKTEPEVVSEMELKPNSKPEPENQIEKEVEVGPDTETHPETESDKGAAIETDVEKEIQVEADIESKTETQTEKEAGIETGMEADTVTATQADIETKRAENEIDMKAQTERESEAETGTVVDTATETQAEVQTGVMSEERDTMRDAQMEVETITQAEKEADKEREKEGGTETEADEVNEVEIQKATERQTGVTESEEQADNELGTETEEFTQPATQDQPQLTPVPAEEEQISPHATRTLSDAEITDIESQIIRDDAAEDLLPSGPPTAENEEPVTPEAAEGGTEPVPVDEVIPDPIHIEPLQELAKEPPVEAAREKQPHNVEKDAITSAEDNSITDNEIQEELDQADKLLPENPGKALHTFGALLHRNPKSARAIYGRARSLDQLAEIEKSNSKLEQAILTYRSVLDLADEEPSQVPLSLLRAAAERCIDRMKFRGFFGKALRVQQRLLQRFPEDVGLRNSMGVTYLLMNQGSAAKEVFEAVLQQWPDNGFAQVHYGFVLKTTYNNMTGGAYYMKKGIDSGAEGTQDERFFFHLGDALQRQGNIEEAYKIYDEAVEKGMFLNRYQRSLYNVDRLTSRPFWTLQQTTYQVFFRKLEENWEVIRNEGVALLGLPVQDGFRPEAENLKDVGDWKQYELFTKGRKITANCVKAPRTCSLIEGFPAAAGCKRGQVKFSVMQPHTHVHAHTGPTNCRLRAHLGLVVPKGVHLKVGQENTTWEEGKFLIFDDSWEHEVWHEGDSFRLVLIVDIWHPELTEQERKTLTPI